MQISAINAVYKRNVIFLQTAEITINRKTHSKQIQQILK
jgi:hypothetical protein